MASCISQNSFLSGNVINTHRFSADPKPQYTSHQLLIKTA